MTTKKNPQPQNSQSQKQDSPLPISPFYHRFVTPYGSHLRVSLDFTDVPSLTKQSFKNECDINVIMAQYLKTGVIDFVQKHSARYGDATGADFQYAMLVVAESRTMFNDLPAALRNRFDNDPAQFLDFVHDENNRDEMASLGLLKPSTRPQAATDAQTPTPPPPAQPSASNAAPAASTTAPVGAEKPKA